MQILLTKVDKVTQQEREDRKTTFRKEFTDLLEGEIQMTERNKEKSNSESKKMVYERHLQNYRGLKEQIQQSSFLEVSCVPGWEDTVKTVTSCLMEFADKQKHLVMLRPIDKELFVKIGKLGIKECMIEPQMSGTDEPRIPGYRRMNEGSQLPGANISKERQDSTYPGQTAATNVKSLLPKDQRVETMQQQYLTFSEVLKVFGPIFRKYQPNCQKEQLPEELEKSLSNLNKRGLLRHFTGDKELENIIFNDISTLMSILRCIFHHELQTSLEYQLTNRCYENRFEFDRDIANLTQHGMLSMILLRHLLLEGKCLIPANVVAKLLSSLDVGIIFTDDTTQKEKIFIPYFLENVQAPQDIEEKKQAITSCQKNVLALQTVVDTNAPTTFFNQLMIKVYKTLSKILKFREAIQLWSQGIFATLDKHQAQLMLYYNSQNEIEFFVRADVTHIDGHKLLWDHVELINTDYSEIKQCKFPGLPAVYILKCTDCRLSGSTEVHDFLVDEMLNLVGQPSEIFKCGKKENLPRALITPMPQGNILV